MASASPFSRRSRVRMAFAVGALAVAVLLGTVGFTLIEGFSLLDSLYLTVQTMTTVGFGDLAPKTAGGRLFALLFMLCSVSAVAYLLSTAVQSAIESELIATFGQRRRSRKMSKLHNHYIVCGAGRVGSHLVRQMQGAGETFVVIENDAEKAQELSERKILVLQRDATIEETLHDAGVEHARGLAACLPDDSDNLYVVLTARGLNPNLHIVARAAEETAERKLKRAGANIVVAPTIIGGHRLAVALRKPAVGEFIDSITVNTLGLEFEQVAVDLASPLAGRKLRETINRSVLDVVIVSIQRKGGEALFNPQGDTQIEAGDVLIAIGSVESLEKLNSMASAV
jgi:voltage-gated potassium channel